jgi:hypothetical protein
MVSIFTWGLFLRLVMCRFLNRQAGWRPVDRSSRRGMFRIAAWLGPTDCPRFHIMFYSYALPPSLSWGEALFSIDDALHYTVVLSLLVT